MKENLIIVFAKNILLGKVKTRLANSIGDWGAFDVYKYLVEVTEKATSSVGSADRHIYFTDVIIESKWEGDPKFVQSGNDLGERMKNAFVHGFSMGYKRIIGVGADLPDLTGAGIIAGFECLESVDAVFGPAEDGGYYLLGMNHIIPEIFENKPWSEESLLKTTLIELQSMGYKFDLLETLNDIDTLEDLKRSSISSKFEHLYDLSGRNK